MASCGCVDDVGEHSGGSVANGSVANGASAGMLNWTVGFVRARPASELLRAHFRVIMID